jgi:ABC-type arginine/histidine transport system permease subunit
MSTNVSEVLVASIIRAIIALIMEAARTSETSVDIQLRTWQYIPEGSELTIQLFFLWV